MYYEMRSITPQYIIAIGASPGPVRDLLELFDHTPATTVCYVILQSLESQQKTVISDLITRHTGLLLEEAKHGANLLTDRVYFIPESAFMTVINNKFYIRTTPGTEWDSFVINRFFTSLAANSEENAIAIILSGSGADATEGAKAIKKSGGFVLARNPETATFGSLSSGVIASGLADRVLEPSLMPFAIVDHIRFRELLADTSQDEPIIKAISELFNGTAHDFSEYTPSALLNRAKRRAADRNFPTLSAYTVFLRQAPHEVQALKKALVLSLTSFFRDKEAFDFLETAIIPGILQNLSRGEELKVWVAGCSTGEEVYSLAILIAEQLKGAFTHIPVKILATDIDNGALLFAAAGIYTKDITRTVSPERIQKFFVREGAAYRVNAELRSMVIFEHHDLVKNSPYPGMHLISCRNILRFVTPSLQKRILTLVLFGLGAGGYLFLGAEETPAVLTSKLQVIHSKWKVYKKSDTEVPQPAGALSLPRFNDTKPRPALPSGETSIDIREDTVLLTDALVKELGALVLVIDKGDQVIRSFGETPRYLLQKHFSIDLKELLPKSLAVSFALLKERSLRIDERVVATGIPITRGQLVAKVKLSIDPLILSTVNDSWLMVSISDDTNEDLKPELVFEEALFLDKYTVSLEKEIKRLEGKLELAQKKRDASDAFMHSFNEELTTANKEMQLAQKELVSTNEEIQALNSDLHEINAGYEAKNNVLAEANDDLDKYFQSNMNGQLFIDRDLRLLRFSPRTAEHIGLSDSENGKAIADIASSINFRPVIGDIESVLADGKVRSRELESSAGQWFQVMIMPAKDVDTGTGQITGVLITLNDITELKRTQIELNQKNQSLQRINDDLDNFIHAASHDLLAPLSNIEGSLQLMNEFRGDDAEQVAFISVIDSSIKKFRSLIQDLAIIARVESDMMILEMVDIGDTVDNIEWSLNNKIASSGAQITKDFSVSKIMFSKKNLRSILYNLISNAIKFRGEEAPRIYISTFRRGDQVIITVEDNGRGISENGLKRIFDMYGRLHQDIEGQGIGLYLARKIVNAAGGSITVQSEVGRGTKFTISLNSGPAE